MATPTVAVRPAAVVIVPTDAGYAAYNLRRGPSVRCSVVGGIQSGARVLAHGGRLSSGDRSRYPTGWQWVLIETEAGQSAWVWGVGVRVAEDGVALPQIPVDAVPACVFAPAASPTPQPGPPPVHAERPLGSSDDEDSDSDPPRASEPPPPALRPTPTIEVVRGIPRPPTPTPTD